MADFQLLIIRQFQLRRRDVADRLQQPMVIETVDPYQRGILEGVDGEPRPTPYGLLAIR